jgi:hypothetical protein
VCRVPSLSAASQLMVKRATRVQPFQGLLFCKQHSMEAEGYDPTDKKKDWCPFGAMTG